MECDYLLGVRSHCPFPWCALFFLFFLVRESGENLACSRFGGLASHLVLLEHKLHFDVSLRSCAGLLRCHLTSPKVVHDWTCSSLTPIR